MISIRSKKWLSLKLIIQSMMVALLVIVSGLWGLLSYAAEAQPSSPPSPVQIKEVKQLDDSPKTEILGTIFSRNQVQLTAGVTGKLEWVIEPGSFVKKGDLVAQIELLPLQLRQAEQSAQLKRAEINLNYLTKQLNRQKELRKTNSASQIQLDETHSQFELARSDLEIARLQLKQANDQLTRATIKAPFEGVITQRLRRAGFDVGRSDILLQMLDTQNLEVRLFVPIKYLTYTRPGSKVTLSSRDNQDILRQLSAVTSTIIPAADPRSQTFEMRVNIPQEGKNFWAAGQLIKVSIPVEASRASLSVHRDALILRRDGTYVIKIDDKNKAHRLKVKVGKGQGDWVTVTGDLSSGDKVAIRGAERLREGQSVIIQSAGR